jgi:SAM-dependent methyltransferase
MVEINLMDRYPQSKRPIEERSAVTDAQRAHARKFDKDFFDGDRLYGYGGYNYHPRFWQETVKRFRDYYELRDDAKILDVGCGKGFMLHDFKELMPRSTVAGIDISEYAIANAMDSMKPFVQVASADSLPYPDNYFDLVISINTIHNLYLEECKQSLREIQRVTKGNAFLTVDAWHDEEEKAGMLKWNLTGVTYMHVDDWKKIFQETGYEGDYYWFIAKQAAVVEST